jgi:hypothetical protein
MSKLNKLGFSLPVSLIILSSPVAAISAPLNSLPASNSLQERAIEFLIGQTGEPDVVIGEPGSSPSTSPTSTSSDPRFTCEFYNGEYTVMYNPESQPGQAYAWAVPRMMGNGWSPERRCTEISNRLESYRPDGLLELTTGIENNYDILCVTTERDPSCRIVLTVPPGQDPELTRDRVFENLSVADSGQTTQGVTTYTNGNSSDRILNDINQVLGNTRPRSSDGINLRPFLDRADGGTGRLLRKGKAKGKVKAKPVNSQQLDPGKFR